MSKKITLEFTYAELDAYYFGATNIWDHSDAVKAVFECCGGFKDEDRPNQKAKAGYRAEEKIRAALAEYRRRRPSEFKK